MASKSVQKNLTSQFMSITGVNEKLAQRLLKGSNWKLEQACDSKPNINISKSITGQGLQLPQSGASTPRGHPQGWEYSEEQETTPSQRQRVPSLTRQIVREGTSLPTQSNEPVELSQLGTGTSRHAPGAHLPSQRPRGILDTPRSRRASAEQTPWGTGIHNQAPNALQLGTGAIQHPQTPSCPAAATHQGISEPFSNLTTSMGQMHLREGVQSMQSNVPFMASPSGMSTSQPAPGFPSHPVGSNYGANPEPLSTSTTRNLSVEEELFLEGMQNDYYFGAPSSGTVALQHALGFQSHLGNISGGAQATPPGLPANQPYANGQFGIPTTPQYGNASNSYAAQLNQQSGPPVDVPPGLLNGYQTGPPQPHGQLPNASYGNAPSYYAPQPYHQPYTPAGNISQRGRDSSLSNARSRGFPHRPKRGNPGAVRTITPSEVSGRGQLRRNQANRGDSRSLGPRLRTLEQNAVPGREQLRGNQANGGVRPANPSLLSQHVTQTSENPCNGEALKELVEVNTGEIRSPFSGLTSPNTNPASYASVTSTSYSTTPTRTPVPAASRSVENWNNTAATPKVQEESGVHSQTERHRASPDSRTLNLASAASRFFQNLDRRKEAQTVAEESSVGSQREHHPASQASQTRAPVLAGLAVQPPGPSINRGGVQNFVDRPLTNAERLLLKHSKASPSNETPSNSAARAPLPLPPPPSDTPERPAPGSPVSNQQPVGTTTEGQVDTSLDQGPESFLHRLPLSERREMEEVFARGAGVRSPASGDRPFTHAEGSSMKNPEASNTDETRSNSTVPAPLPPPPSSPDGSSWPTLAESNAMGKKGKTKKRNWQGPKPEPKDETKPGPKPGPGPGPDSGSNLPVFAVHISDNQVDWSTVLDSMQTTSETVSNFAFEREQNANPKANSYFASNGSGPLAKEKDSLAKLFEKYRESTDEEDKTGVNGTMRYLQDLGLNLESAEILLPLEIAQAPALAEMSKEGFVDGWKTVGADTIPKQKAYVAGQLKQLSTDMALFKKVYRHTFVCSREQGQKALPLENALVYWEMIFNAPGKPWITGTPPATTNWTNLWIEFLRANWTKTVNKDMWNQTFEFFQKTMQDETLSFWSEDGAWPGVIDEFVAYVKGKRGDLPDTMETD